jgi:hypothetical protein
MKGIDPKYIMWLGIAVGIEQAIGHGTVSLTNIIPPSWAPYVTSWCNLLAFIGTSIMTYQAAISGPQTGPLFTPPNFTPTVVKILIAAFALSMFLPVGSLHAQPLPRKRLPPPLALTGDPIADIKTDIAGVLPAAGVTKNADGTVACNFNVFANLNPKNLIATIQACVSDANSTFEPDVAAALASAQSYSGAGSNGGSGDAAAIQCLQPGLAIVQAGIQRPAVAAQAAVPATATTPAIPAVAAVAAYKPGAITLFQKFREFVLAGGPSACQNWVNGTVQGAVLPAAGVVGAAVGAAALVP